jgi:polysaccharide export outer membrane protein
MASISFKISVLLFFGCLFFSCTSKKKITYLQDIDIRTNPKIAAAYEPKLQADDVLKIYVSAENPEITTIFNVPEIQGSLEMYSNSNLIRTYLIGNDGTIDFPVLGKLKLAGFTVSEARKKIQLLVSEYIKNPVINLRILNYKIAVLGEVNKPGSYNIGSERITILDALSLAGDLSIYGKRNNVLLIRESEGVKSYHRIDLTTTSFLDSPYYYLSQNDIIIVEPNKTKINTSVVGPNATLILSAVSILTTIFALISK